MKKGNFVLAALAVALLCSASVFADTLPAGAPAGSTGLCKDGTYTNVASKSGACAGHKGVKTWFGPAAPPKTPTATKPTPPKPTTAATATPKPAPTPTPAPAPAPKPAPAPAPKPAPGSASGSASTGGAPAPGGGPGMVWVNISTHVYHCPTDRYYGKTKNGKYLTEAAAQAEHDKPDAGKKCF
jgi:hypothetical protein